MRKLILFMHVSLDGFVAGSNGEMNWIHVDDAIFDYADRLTTESDAALYGRVTYEMMDAYWPTAADQPSADKHAIHHSRWYNRVQKIVVSNSLEGRDIPNTQVIGSENLETEVRRFKESSGKNICIFGSPSASHALMRLDLIDEYWLFINPVLMGAGIPLFKDLQGQVRLQLVESKTFDSGVIGAHYVKI